MPTKPGDTVVNRVSILQHSILYEKLLTQNRSTSAKMYREKKENGREERVSERPRGCAYEGGEGREEKGVMLEGRDEGERKVGVELQKRARGRAVKPR